MKKLILSIAVLCITQLSFSVQAGLNITITEGVDSAVPIAVFPFDTSDTKVLDIAQVVASDLQRSAHFKPVGRDKLAGMPSQHSSSANNQWRTLGVESVIVGSIKSQGNGSYKVEFRLFDVIKNEQITGYSFNARSKDMRKVGHRISDIVFQQLTGVKGAFDTKIAYVMAKDKRNGQKQYVLAIADSDGYNEQIILKSPWPLMSPAWSPDAKQLAYVSFEKGRPRIFIQDLASGKRQLISEEKGLNGAPAWSHDGRFLALTLSRDNNAEVYVMEVATRKLNRITQNSAIDTEASWAPDGNVICFTSDRGGRPQLYEVKIDEQGKRDSRPKRISFEGDYNSRPTYSPDGRYIAMVHGERGRYQIAVMDRNNGQLWIVADTRLGESPSFAPNSAMLIYASEVRNQGVLEAVTVEGRGRQRLGLQTGDVREPAWSPYLP